MEYAQKLFEGININGKHIALITYIRTDSPEFAPEFLPILEDFVKKEYGKEYFYGVRKAKKKENTQDGHEAIRPVDLSMTPEKLEQLISDKNLIKVYDIIYKRTIATAMTPNKISETIYTISSNENLFEFSSKEQLFDGFKKVYKYDDSKDDVVLETFEIGEQLKVSSIEAQEKETNPPKRFKEATFIKELESTGIGRPSTFATIVSTILDSYRGYCEVNDKYIVPTEKGILLNDFLEESFPNLINVKYTSNMEKDLDKIANGKLKEKDFLNDFYETMENVVKNKFPNSTSEITDRICPECGKPLVIRTGKFGKFLGCSGYPNCKHVEKLK